MKTNSSKRSRHFTITALAGLITLSSGSELPPEVTEQISEITTTSTTHLMKAVALVDDEKEDRNLLQLVKELKSMGFGEEPVTPPWMDKVDEHHREEVAGRIKMMGQEDMEKLKGLDLDKNLELTEEETRKAITGKVRFDVDDMMKVDQDGDGKLTIKEYALAVPARGDERDEDGVDWHQRGHFEEADRNDDGFIDPGEIVAGSERSIVKPAMLIHLSVAMKKADADGDGELTRDEFAKLSEEADEQWQSVAGEEDTIELKSAIPKLYWLTPATMAPILAP